MSTPIEHYAMLGDCRSAALVCRNGSIDWLCLPRFDSEAVFAALLGTPEHGRWLLCPQDEAATSHRQYRDGSLVLETTFETDTGAVRVVDFMVTSQNGNPHSHLVRCVEAVRGRVPMRTELVMRFGHGHIVPWVTQQDDGLRAVAGPDQLVLRSPVPIKGRDMTSQGHFTLDEGERTWFVLSHGPSHLDAPEAVDPEDALAITLAFWEDWSNQCAPAGRWSAQVKRSLVVLKGLSYLPTGAIIAAPTASLPEQLGGERNWDYRYCWLRDSSFTLLALMNAGFHNEAGAFRDWVKRAVAGTPGQLQSLYGVGGERRLPEWSAPWLPGYDASRPVNFGNAAADQFQLDVYGELIALFEIARLRGMPAGAYGNQLERAFLLELEKRWQEPDEGIWEVRSGRRHFTHSKLMAWLALHLAAQNDQSGFCDQDRQRWRQTADTVHAQILARGLHRDGYFVQSYDSEELDAALLLMPMVGFLPADDPRVIATVDAISERLTVDGLVKRYSTHGGVDGLPAGEGTFLACSFWLVEALVMIGRIDRATTLYDHLCGLCNDVGLLAEEYDPKGQRMLGNFPQGYSHVALVNAAYRLTHLHNAKRSSPEVLS
ncbi:glycoside hydrolase family 15 protein [Pseudoxanthomonas sp.]|uniref:glycoside hydrolase family 15 protein n=1 Tax=Pseudoxanthomonas sp. TaxID=1871049 RepID=UPI0026173694|nr:glycoside hydrolase family 15 protein [Pseudoxanthomonas sp.]WDS37233.1 MAG: glycoside hydrolase family 15 protein [Pseudoxanthomonas sp.]